MNDPVIQAAADMREKAKELAFAYAGNASRILYGEAALNGYSLACDEIGSAIAGLPLPEATPNPRVEINDDACNLLFSKSAVRPASDQRDAALAKAASGLRQAIKFIEWQFDAMGDGSDDLRNHSAIKRDTDPIREALAAIEAMNAGAPPVAPAKEPSIKNARIFAVSTIKYSLDHVIAQFDQMMSNGMIPDITKDYALSNARLAIMAINDALKV